MKAGDLVTLSTYSLMSATMWRWRQKVWNDKQSLVGIVTKVVDNPTTNEHTSDNEKKYYFVKWVTDGPNGRWAFLPFSSSSEAYFFRKDLKFVK
jgi:hypothetical protein